MIQVQNTNVTNTFDFWRNRTNELATAMSTAVITSDASPYSTNTSGNAVLNGTFSAYTFKSNTLFVTSNVAIGNLFLQASSSQGDSINIISGNNIAVINSIYFSATAENSNHLNNLSASAYQLSSTLYANVVGILTNYSGTVNASSFTADSTGQLTIGNNSVNVSINSSSVSIGGQPLSTTNKTPDYLLIAQGII